MHNLWSYDRIYYICVRIYKIIRKRRLDMEQNKLSTKDAAAFYREEVLILMEYIPWFEAQKDKYEQTYYTDSEQGSGAMAVPTYDNMLLRFVKEARLLKLMNPNYVYLYRKYRIRDYKDEWKLIDAARIDQMDLLCGILSRYVLKGMTKGLVWTEGVQHEIFLRIIVKMKELIEFHQGTSI